MSSTLDQASYVIFTEPRQLSRTLPSLQSTSSVFNIEGMRLVSCNINMSGLLKVHRQNLTVLSAVATEKFVISRLDFQNNTIDGTTHKYHLIEFEGGYIHAKGWKANDNSFLSSGFLRGTASILHDFD